MLDFIDKPMKNINRPQSLIVIDDDTSSLDLLKFIFSKNSESLCPYFCSSAIKGFELCKEIKPDLIMLDVLMPEMNGFELCKMIKSDKDLQHIPVIFITAAKDTNQIIEGFKTGAVDYITKPFNKSELLARVNNHIELKTSRDLIIRQNILLQTEIEERKLADEKFRALSETSFEAILFTDDDRIIEANEAALQLFGYQYNQLLGQNINKLFKSNAPDSAINKQSSSKIESPDEIIALKANGEEFFCEIHGRKIKYRGHWVSVTAIRDITFRKDIERQIMNAIIETEETERKRFARDLHDGLGALLSTVKIFANLAQKKEKSEDEKFNLLEQLKETIAEAIATTRRIANNLMPGVLSDFGLVPAISAFCSKVDSSGALNISFSADHSFPRLSQNIEINLYRVIMELINNTLKHAHARNIFLQLSYNSNKVKIEYTDDGKGFNLEEKLQHGQTNSMGLGNIATRVKALEGELHFETGEGKGIKVDIFIPLDLNN